MVFFKKHLFNSFGFIGLTNLSRTSRNQEIFATKAQRHEGFQFIIIS